MFGVTHKIRILLGVLFAPVLAGCGGSGGSVIPRTLTAATHHGLSYTLVITGSGKTACTTQTYRTSLPGGQPILQSAHLCGPAIVYGHPLLVQSHSSAESILVDVPKSGCGKVLATQKGGPFTALSSHCSSTSPSFRVTVLPAARRLVLRGLTNVPVINFPRHVCKKGLCITALSQG